VAGPTCGSINFSGFVCEIRALVGKTCVSESIGDILGRINPFSSWLAMVAHPGKVQGTLPQQLEKVGPWELGPDRTDFAKSLAKLIGSAQNRLMPD